MPPPYPRFPPQPLAPVEYRDVRFQLASFMLQAAVFLGAVALTSVVNALNVEAVRRANDERRRAHLSHTVGNKLTLLAVKGQGVPGPEPPLDRGSARVPSLRERLSRSATRSTTGAEAGVTSEDGRV